MRARLTCTQRIVFRLAALAAALVGAGPLQHAQAQIIFAPTRLIESFENTSDIARFADAGDASLIYVSHSQTPNGATRGSKALLVETEGAFQLNDGVFSNGWGALGGIAVNGDYTAADATAYDALQTAALNPDAWDLVFDVTTDANSWVEAPSTSTSTTVPGDIGPDRSGVRVQMNYDGAVGTSFNTGSIYGTTGRNTIKVPFRSLFDPNFALPTTGAATYSLRFGADNNRFNPEDPAPNGGAKIYIDNVRLKPKTPVVGDVVWDFETDASNFQGWSDTGNSGTDTSHKHHIVTGNGATAYNAATNKFLPSATGHGLLIDTSNIPTGSNGFQWGSAMVLNSDTDNNGAVDDAVADGKLRNLIGRMRKSEALQFDVTFHDSLVPPDGLPPAVVPFEGNAPWIKLVMGIWVDSTPADGAANGLTQYQFDNSFGVDALGNNIETARGDLAGILTTEVTPDMLAPDEPLVFTYPFAQLGSLASQLNTALFDNTNYLRISLAVQTDTGANTILATIDNIRLLTSVALDADFDHDGDVDGDDLGVFKASYGVNGNGDANDDGVTDGADMLIWQRQLGNDATKAVAAASAAPEPAAGALAACAIAAFAGTRRGRRG
jgi:hypothetical protein